jgi:hypothetical protein
MTFRLILKAFQVVMLHQQQQSLTISFFHFTKTCLYTMKEKEICGRTIKAAMKPAECVGEKL